MFTSLVLYIAAVVTLFLVADFSGAKDPSHWYALGSLLLLVSPLYCYLVSESTFCKRAQ